VSQRRPGRLRGQATVELAITLIVLVPIVFYVLFLHELLAYSLEWQEAIVTPAWDGVPNDFVPEWLRHGCGDRHDRAQYCVAGSSGTDFDNSPVNYEDTYQGRPAKPSVALKAELTNRLNYCDHTSTVDAYDTARTEELNEPIGNVSAIAESCDSREHHVALRAHQCWLGAGAKHIRCTLTPTDESSADAPGSDFVFLAHEGSRAHAVRGGLVSCTAKLSVINYFLPNVFLNLSDRGTLLTDKERATAGSDVHGAATTQNSWVFGAATPDRFAVLHNSWNLNAIKDLDPRYSPRDVPDLPTGGVALPHEPVPGNAERQYGDETVRFEGWQPRLPVGDAAAHPLYRRTRAYYDSLASEGARAARDFAVGLTSDGILDDVIGTDDAEGIGNDPLTPSVAFRSTYDEEGDDTLQDPTRLFDKPPNTSSDPLYWGRNHGHFASGWDYFLDVEPPDPSDTRWAPVANPQRRQYKMWLRRTR
jgi:hypothetical protein